MLPNPQFPADLVIFTEEILKGTVMQIDKALINALLRVSKVSWKFHIPTTYNLTVIYPWNLLLP